MKKIILISAICFISTMAHSQWSLTGNAGTSGSTNFIGTTDNVSFKIRTKNLVRMTVSNTGKVGIGIITPAFKLDVKGGSINTDSVYRIGGNRVLSTAGIANTFVGTYSGSSNTTGGFNAANGHSALETNNTGYENTANGAYVLRFNATGYQNTGIGAYALYLNTGEQNTATGASSLFSNTSGTLNTANGFKALWENTTASQNTAIGSFALLNQSFDNLGTEWVSANTAVGFDALRSNQPTQTLDGFANTAVGHSALRNNTTGYENTASGHRALFSNLTGRFNTANGVATLYYNTTGSSNNAFGYTALLNNTTGNDNFACGLNALYSNTAAGRNIAIGTSALAVQSYNPGAPWVSGNVAIGYDALTLNQPVSTGTGVYNTATGTSSLHSNTSGYHNTATGSTALYLNTTGTFNTGHGYGTLYNTTTANRNTALGYSAGALFANSNYNTFVGAYCDANAGGHLNSSAIGDAANITASNQVRLGDNGVISIGGYAGWTTLPSDGRFKKNVQENVPGIEFISKLRPVTYTVDVHGVNKYTGVKEEGKESIYGAKSRIRYTGFIAQEVEIAAAELGFDFSGIDAPKNEKDMYGLRYAEFVVPLVKAVQELNETLKSENEKLKAEIAEIKNQLNNGSIDKFSKATSSSENKLEQNNPNPFSDKTIINYSISNDAVTPVIIIRSLDGVEVKRIVLEKNNAGAITVECNQFTRGTYTYTLEVNGKSVDTKLMVITK